MDLTKIWLLLLAINICLQFDAVEDFFNSLKASTGRVVVAELECSSLSNLRASDSKDQFFAVLTFAVGITNKTNHFTAAVEVSDLDSLLSQKSHSWLFAETFTRTSRDFSLVSGLSPPVFFS